MALYYDAATVLGTDLQVGSLKSRVYDGTLGLQSKPAHLYALISETAKYDTFLSEVINNAGILALEPKVSGPKDRSMSRHCSLTKALRPLV